MSLVPRRVFRPFPCAYSGAFPCTRGFDTDHSHALWWSSSSFVFGRSGILVHSHAPSASSCSFRCVTFICVHPCGRRVRHSLVTVGFVRRSIPVRPRGPFPSALGVVWDDSPDGFMGLRVYSINQWRAQVVFGPFPCAL